MKIVYGGKSKEHVTNKDIEYYSSKYKKQIELENEEYSLNLGATRVDAFTPKQFIGLHFDVHDDYLLCKPIVHMKPFDRIRRITGYLVGTTDRFNDAKKSEEKDRVKHTKGVE